MLANTLRQLEESAFEYPFNRLRPLDLAAVRSNRQPLRNLAQRLEADTEPVTPAGMLRVLDLITDGASPLYGTTSEEPLAAAIEATLELLKPWPVSHPA